MGTRFIGTHECDAHDNLKQVLIDAKAEDIQLMSSPVGYPAQGVVTNLTHMVAKREGPAIKCISNCVAPCNRGEEAKAVGFCIADRLSDAYEGNLETGLFFSGTNGYKLKELISVKELMTKLTQGE
jgi:nitronate monooxygenase